MSRPEDTLRDHLHWIMGTELHADSVLVGMTSSSEWDGDVLSEESGGLTEIVWKLFGIVDSSRQGVPTLVIGLLPTSLVEARVKRLGGRQLMLWQWPGFTYIPYGFGEEEFLSAAYSVVDGAKEPLPVGLLPKRVDVLRVTSEVRHWLENRRANVESARNDFGCAARGEFQLHHSHLDPVTAISEAHRRMLRRLWGLEPAARRFAPKAAGLEPMKFAVEEFTARWVELEAKRAALKASGIAKDTARLNEMVAALSNVDGAIDKAIAASRMLDAEISAGEAN